MANDSTDTPTRLIPYNEPSPRTGLAATLGLGLTAAVMGSAAAGMGWGIRGQYGHETGAMVPGALTAMALVFLFGRQLSSLQAARAVALTAVAFGFGGTMTYGQTVGLTHDTELVGNWAAYRWGMLGLFIKGGLWIGFGGAFLGIGLGGKKYRVSEMAILFLVLIVLVFLGTYLINEPFRPHERILPKFYFSDHWHWEPDKVDMRPRREEWGGLMLGLAGLIAYVWFIKKDRLGRNMAFIGILAGGLGFTIGQALQSLNAWMPGWLSEFDKSLHSWVPFYPEVLFSGMSWNWWNMMETTFGLVLGAVLGIGLFLNRGLVAAPEDHEQDEKAPELSMGTEWLLFGVHAAALVVTGFLDDYPEFRRFDMVANVPLAMGLIPAMAIVGGRYWPYLLTFPLLAIPIAGKTLRMMSYRLEPSHPHYFEPLLGWLNLLFFPLAIMIFAALYFEWRGLTGQAGRTFTRWGLILLAWFYFFLNFVFFEFPWPWEAPTARSTNNWIFLGCTAILTLGALTLCWWRQSPSAAAGPQLLEVDEDVP